MNTVTASRVEALKTLLFGGQVCLDGHKGLAWLPDPTGGPSLCPQLGE